MPRGFLCFKRAEGCACAWRLSLWHGWRGLALGCLVVFFPVWLRGWEPVDRGLTRLAWGLPPYTRCGGQLARLLRCCAFAKRGRLVQRGASMNFNESLVYRKTERGQAEYKNRVDNLPSRWRTVLIMVNAVDTGSTLCQKMGVDAAAILAELAARGYIEPVQAAQRPASNAQPPVPAALPLKTPAKAPHPTPPPVQASTPDTAVAERLVVLRKAAMKELSQHFGPDTPTVVKGLYEAKTLVDFNQVLDTIGAKLAIYLGRQKAAQLVDGLRAR